MNAWTIPAGEELRNTFVAPLSLTTQCGQRQRSFIRMPCRADFIKISKFPDLLGELSMCEQCVPSTRRPQNLFQPRDHVMSSNLVWISNELDARWTFKHCFSQLASLIEMILTRRVERSIISSWCFYFCWLLCMVVEVVLTRKIQVQILAIFGVSTLQSAV